MSQRIEGLARAVRGAPAAWLSTELQHRIFRCRAHLWFDDAERRAQDAVARALADEANELWEARLGPMREWEGFQVEFIPESLRLKCDAPGVPIFESTLYGGRCTVGTAEQIRERCRLFVASRRAKRSKALDQTAEQPGQR